MNKELQELCLLLEFPDEATNYLLDAFDALMKIQEVRQSYDKWRQEYTKDCHIDFDKAVSELEETAKESGINSYTIDFLFLLGLAKPLLQHYINNGHTFEMWKTSMMDLKYKLIECHEVHSVWGTFVAGWQYDWFVLRRFAFYNLQFDYTNVSLDVEVQGVVLKEDSLAINVHIPRTGKRLDMLEVNKAFLQAKEFFAKEFNEGKVVFICGSWMLFPENKEMLSPTSNMYAFMELFEIVKRVEFDNYNDLWRLFDCDMTKVPLEELPQNTSLRRAYVERMRRGEKTGYGIGIRIM